MQLGLSRSLPLAQCNWDWGQSDLQALTRSKAFFAFAAVVHTRCFAATPARCCRRRRRRRQWLLHALHGQAVRTGFVRLRSLPMPSPKSIKPPKRWRRHSRTRSSSCKAISGWWYRPGIANLRPDQLTALVAATHAAPPCFPTTPCGFVDGSSIGVPSRPERPPDHGRAEPDRAAVQMCRSVSSRKPTRASALARRPPSLPTLG